MGHLVNYLFRRTFYQSQPCRKRNCMLNCIYVLCGILYVAEEAISVLSMLPPLGLAPKGNAFVFFIIHAQGKGLYSKQVATKSAALTKKWLFDDT